LKLLDDGSIQGTVTYKYTGHTSRGQKDYYDDKTPAQIEEDWKKTLQERLSTAEIADFEMRDMADTAKPMVVTYKVTVPGYANHPEKLIHGFLPCRRREPSETGLGATRLASDR
jgi:hypothetical protein